FRLCRLHLWSNYCEFGFCIANLAGEPPFTVNTVIANTPASTGGLRNKDVLLQVNDVDVTNAEYKFVVQFIENRRDNVGSIDILVCESEDYQNMKFGNKLFDPNLAILLETPSQMPVEISHPSNVECSKHNQPIFPSSWTSVDCRHSHQVQCLHCSKLVCMECAQKHVSMVNDRVGETQHLFNSKIDVLNQIEKKLKDEISLEFKKAMRQLIKERDRCYAQLTEKIETKKRDITANNDKMLKLPLNEVSVFIDKALEQLSNLSELEKLFSIVSVARMQLQAKV
ncbi:unnamed protein product, partial [Didymodactylos carnosus]